MMDKQSVTGIDISHNSLKAVVLKPSGSSYALLGYKEIILDDAIVAENNTINHQEIVKTLKQVKKGLPLGARRVAISVPENTVVSKKLLIEQGLERSEREFAVLQAFSHQSPFPIEELSLDFVRLESDEATARCESYQVFATRKDVVESRISALQKAGLKAVLVDVQSQCLGHIWKLAVERFPDKSKFCLLDIGALTTSLTMFTENDELFHKDFSYRVNLVDGMDGADPLTDDSALGVERFCSAMAERVRRQMQLYASINGAQNIKGIWLSGDGAYVPALAESLSNQLNIECEPLNPLGLFEMKVAKRKRGAADWSRFTTAAGLAVRGIQWLGGDHAVSH